MGTVFDAGNSSLSAIDLGWADAFSSTVDEGGVDPVDLSSFDRSSTFLNLSVIKLHIWQLIASRRCASNCSATGNVLAGSTTSFNLPVDSDSSAVPACVSSTPDEAAG